MFSSDWEHQDGVSKRSISLVVQSGDIGGLRWKENFYVFVTWLGPFDAVTPILGASERAEAAR